ncbi:hypothetical protein Bca4012_046279 [Brassica carinata]|uniref:Uncharacterized protein n=1 Tax=Brassica carinata TaxID=52824 RepID=A0A8X7UCW7_BRACI|nr:hypothetical protein Bca52824_056544 [Brassica carinata]
MFLLFSIVPDTCVLRISSIAITFQFRSYLTSANRGEDFAGSRKLLERCLQLPQVRPHSYLESGKLITCGSTDDLGQSYVTSGKHCETPEPFPLPPEVCVQKAEAGLDHCVARAMKFIHGDGQNNGKYVCTTTTFALF